MKMMKRIKKRKPDDGIPERSIICNSKLNDTEKRVKKWLKYCSSLYMFRIFLFFFVIVFMSLFAWIYLYNEPDKIEVFELSLSIFSTGFSVGSIIYIPDKSNVNKNDKHETEIEQQKRKTKAANDNTEKDNLNEESAAQYKEESAQLEKAKVNSLNENGESDCFISMTRSKINIYFGDTKEINNIQDNHRSPIIKNENGEIEMRDNYFIKNNKSGSVGSGDGTYNDNTSSIDFTEIEKILLEILSQLSQNSEDYKTVLAMLEETKKKNLSGIASFILRLTSTTLGKLAGSYLIKVLGICT